MVSSKELENLCINTIRFLAVDGVQKANSGHPGMPMGCAPIAYYLYANEMKHTPANPRWINRDRFVLSAGHGSMLLYSTLHLCGYKITIDDLKNFRQWGSITPGHPEFRLTEGVETTTGPLGQGFANAVGMAIAREYYAALFNKPDISLIDHFIYGICSDGDLMEGISHEAASLAGHLKLGSLIFFYDDNGISIDGETKLSFSDDTAKRFEAYHWHVQNISDVNDIEQIATALENAKRDPRPSIIITKTHIGYGSPNKQDKEAAHGSPLGQEEVLLTKKNLQWISEEPFFVPVEVREYFKSAIKRNSVIEKEWTEKLKIYSALYPEDAEKFGKFLSGDWEPDWDTIIPVFPDDGKKIATRQASGKVISAISKNIPAFIGGSADLAPSNNTYVSGVPAFSAENYSGRNFHFGIREHGMASILNGMAMYGGIIPYGGTFLVFADYLRPALRLASLSHIGPIFVLTHDSIGLGEDGPTHQPVEHLASLRSIPRLLVLRPADANETIFSWKTAITFRDRPTVIALTRQGVPVLDTNKYPIASGVEKGAYILLQTSDNPMVILMGSGSEVHLLIDSAEKLRAEDIFVRVVSFPSWELFEMQSDDYKNSVLPREIKKRIAVEAGVTMGWEKYTGDEGIIIGLNRFGASAPYEILMKEFGFTAENVCNAVKKLVND